MLLGLLLATHNLLHQLLSHLRKEENNKTITIIMKEEPEETLGLVVMRVQVETPEQVLVMQVQVVIREQVETPEQVVVMLVQVEMVLH
jgi:hypothetical protein